MNAIIQNSNTEKPGILFTQISVIHLEFIRLKTGTSNDNVVRVIFSNKTCTQTRKTSGSALKLSLHLRLSLGFTLHAFMRL